MPIDADSLHVLLDEAVRRHRMPGATLAVLDGANVTVTATTVLHRGTRVPATPDSLFQIGSITKSLDGPPCSLSWWPRAGSGSRPGSRGPAGVPGRRPSRLCRRHVAPLAYAHQRDRR